MTFCLRRSLLSAAGGRIAHCRTQLSDVCTLYESTETQASVPTGL